MYRMSLSPPGSLGRGGSVSAQRPVPRRYSHAPRPASSEASGTTSSLGGHSLTPRPASTRTARCGAIDARSMNAWSDTRWRWRSPASAKILTSEIQSSQRVGQREKHELHSHGHHSRRHHTAIQNRTQASGVDDASRRSRPIWTLSVGSAGSAHAKKASSSSAVIRVAPMSPRPAQLYPREGSKTNATARTQTALFGRWRRRAYS